MPLRESARLTTWAAEAIATTIGRETNLAPSIKPPNDVYLNDRKVAGVLVDTKAGSAQTFAAVVGIGVNINHTPEDFPPDLRDRAGSLAMALGRKLDRAAFATSLLRELEGTRVSLLYDPQPA
jgi:BirA family biotin operon repressor/biotin-[acetyl-CoA-carboxylase] ligase